MCRDDIFAKPHEHREFPGSGLTAWNAGEKVVKSLALHEDLRSDCSVETPEQVLSEAQSADVVQKADITLLTPALAAAEVEDAETTDCEIVSNRI